MRIGLQIPTIFREGNQVSEAIGDLVERTDQAGFDSLWVMDHFLLKVASERSPAGRTTTISGDLQTPEGEIREVLEAWSTLAFAAARTKQVKLGTLVTGITYRYPGALVKIANSLDALSHGRIYFGVGAAWAEDEHHRLGIPFPSTSERFERLEEALQIALQMWANEDKPYIGKYYQLSNTSGSPLFVQRPHPPILVGGGGEQKTLRLVAKYANACNIAARYGLDVMRRKLEVLREHCQVVNRSYDEIEKTTTDMIQLTPDGQDDTFSPAALVDRYATFASLGFEHVMVYTPNSFDPHIFELLATRVVPEVKKIGVSSTRSASTRAAG